MSFDTKSCPSFMTSATGRTAALIIEWMSMLDTCDRHSLSITVPGLVQANVYRVSDTSNRPIMFQNNPGSGRRKPRCLGFQRTVRLKSYWRYYVVTINFILPVWIFLKNFIKIFIDNINIYNIYNNLFT